MTCNFEKGECDWTSLSDDAFKWERLTGQVENNLAKYKKNFFKTKFTEFLNLLCVMKKFLLKVYLIPG